MRNRLSPFVGCRLGRFSRQLQELEAEHALLHRTVELITYHWVLRLALSVGVVALPRSAWTDRNGSVH
jgi:hypothetical protein